MCTKSQLTAVTSEVVKKAKAVFGEKLAAVILYGSYARGDFNDESDIDIMIIADISVSEISKLNRYFSDYSVDIDLENDVVLSVAVQDKATFDRYKSSNPFFKNIEREGVDLVA
mgnify:FL=1